MAGQQIDTEDDGFGAFSDGSLENLLLSMDKVSQRSSEEESGGARVRCSMFKCQG